jgi:DNA-binding MurR/RpiR family transcriptional regulator
MTARAKLKVGVEAYEALRTRIARKHEALPGRLRDIAEFALEHPTEMALGTVAEVARRARVQPSAIVRFARAMDFDGFTAMQQVFRLRLVANVGPTYRDRLAGMKRDGAWRDGKDAHAVLTRFTSQGIASLEALPEMAREHDIARAIAMLGAARTIYLLGLGGSYPVAAHFTYVLRRLGRPVAILDGIGGALREQAVSASEKDALVAISFQTYNADTVRLFGELAARGVPAISITDNLLSPIAKGAAVVFEMHDMPEAALRTLVAPMCLAQTLAVGLSLALD